MTRQTAKQKNTSWFDILQKALKRDQNRRWRRNQCMGRHRAMFFVLKSDTILTILLSGTRLVSGGINQVWLSSDRNFFFRLFAIIFDIYVIICLFKMSTRFFMIPTLRVNCKLIQLRSSSCGCDEEKSWTRNKYARKDKLNDGEEMYKNW